MSAWYERHSKSMAPFFAYNEYSVLNLVIHQLQKNPLKAESFNMRSFSNSESIPILFFLLTSSLGSVQL